MNHVINRVYWLACTIAHGACVMGYLLCGFVALGFIGLAVGIQALALEFGREAIRARHLG